METPDSAPRMVRRPPGRPVPRQVVFALGALGLVMMIGSVFSADGAFFSTYTHTSTLGQIAGYGILACGLTVVILTGGIDLSVGSVVALAGVVAASLAMRSGWPGWAAAGAAVVVAGVCGAASGSLVAFLRVQPFVATLAMMAFARGAAKWVSEGTKVGMQPPPALLEAFNTRLPLPKGGLELPVCVLLMLVCVLGTWALLRLTILGVYVYGVGDNETAARYAGVPVARVKLIAYTVCGALAGLAGLVFAALERQGNPDGGVGYELTAIAMVVIGGTSLSGGRGGVMPTLLGVLTIGYLQKVLDINGLETSTQLMVTGGIIVLAVLVQGLGRGPR